MGGTKLDHRTRKTIRIRAVKRVLAGESPEVVVKALGFSGQRIYEWLARYREGGEEALRFRGIPGIKRKLSDTQMRKHYDIVTNKNPLQLGFRFALSTRGMVRQLILERFGVRLSESQGGRLLKGMGLTAQRPLRRAMERDPERVGRWPKEEHPRIHASAREKRATIYFGDEAGVRSDYHSGTTWAPRGKTPVVESTRARFRLNLISGISSKGAATLHDQPQEDERGEVCGLSKKADAQPEKARVSDSGRAFHSQGQGGEGLRGVYHGEASPF
jgi:transposase